ncbi:MAG: DUF697 domain-containing protein [Rhodospirillaceae bacterium]
MARRLPKATTKTMKDLTGETTVADPAAATEPTAEKPAPRRRAPRKAASKAAEVKTEAATAAAPEATTASEPPAAKPKRPSRSRSKAKAAPVVEEVAADAPTEPPAGNAGDAPGEDAASPVQDEREAARIAVRRAKAHSLVERFAVFGGIGGFLPMPILDTATVFAVQLSLAKKLAAHYDQPFQPDRARAVIYSVAGAVVPMGAEAVTLSVLGKANPLAIVAGLAVSTITAVATTRKVGNAFIERYESGEGV